MQHPTFGEGTIISTEDGRIVVFFGDHGYKTLSMEAVSRNHLLQPAPRRP